MELHEELCAYTPCDLQEEASREVAMRYIKEFPNVYIEDNTYGHIASSLWIINADVSKMSMTYHNIYNFWDRCGGHMNGGRDLIHVALKEGGGEAGLKEFELLSESTLAIGILPIPPHVKRGTFVSSHVHLNVTYLYQVDEWDMLCSKPNGNSGVR